MQAKQLACLGFMVAGRSHETPGSGTASSITQHTASSRICGSSPCPSPIGVIQISPQECQHTQWVASRERNLELRDPKSYRMSSRQACPFLWIVSVSSEAVMLCRDAWKDTLLLSVSSLLVRYTEMRETLENCHPTTSSPGTSA